MLLLSHNKMERFVGLPPHLYKSNIPPKPKYHWINFNFSKYLPLSPGAGRGRFALLYRWGGILLVISFTAVAVFGVFLMSDHARCLGSFSEGIPCPSENPLAFIAFPLSAFRGFSTAVFQSSLSLAAVALFLAAFLLFLVQSLFFAVRPFSFLFRGLRGIFLGARFSARRKNIRWTALHELSPTVFRARFA